MGSGRWKFHNDNGETWIEISTPVPTRYLISDGPKRFPNLKAILMDMDGSSTDTEKLVLESMRRAMGDELRNPGFAFAQHDFANIIGDSTTNHMKYLSRTYGFAPERIADVMGGYYRYYHQLLGDIASGKIKDKLIEPMPHLRELLEKARAEGIKVGLVTSSIGKEVDMIMPVVFAGMGFENTKYREFYDAVLYADFVGEPFLKPHPNLYTLCMERLGVKAEDCFVVEDSSAGMLAGRIAGCSVLGVPHAHTKDHNFEFANLGMAKDGLMDIIEGDFFRA